MTQYHLQAKVYSRVANELQANDVPSFYSQLANHELIILPQYNRKFLFSGPTSHPEIIKWDQEIAISTQLSFYEF